MKLDAIGLGRALRKASLVPHPNPELMTRPQSKIGCTQNLVRTTKSVVIGAKGEGSTWGGIFTAGIDLKTEVYCIHSIDVESSCFCFLSTGTRFAQGRKQGGCLHRPAWPLQYLNAHRSEQQVILAKVAQADLAQNLGQKKV